MRSVRLPDKNDGRGDKKIELEMAMLCLKINRIYASLEEFSLGLPVTQRTRILGLVTILKQESA